jgi:hypothetical protein
MMSVRMMNEEMKQKSITKTSLRMESFGSI